MIFRAILGLGAMGVLVLAFALIACLVFGALWGAFYLLDNFV